MDFNEQFPSLKDKAFDSHWESTGPDVIFLEDIEKYLIDKQLVRKAIDSNKINIVLMRRDEDYIEFQKRVIDAERNRILKELGLNGELRYGND